MENNMICTFCNNQPNEGTLIEFDGRLMCEHCYHTQTTVCDCCGDRIWRDEAQGNSSTVLCNHCYEYNYSECESCGCLIHNEYVLYDNDDYPYCEECFRRINNSNIKPYSYKPDPIFYGSGDLYMGVEIEIDRGGYINNNAQKILDIANASDEHIYCKHDGSIDDGFEIVSHPMTLNYHINEMNWSEIFEKAVDMGYRSHQTQTCGLHIHVNRSAFGDTYDKQEATIAKIVYFFESHWNELVKFSRRTEANLNHWASRYGISDNAKETYKKAKDKHMGRYVAVNLTNYNTVEFRIFRGTLCYKTFIATLQLIDEICKLAYRFPDKFVEDLSWSDFVLCITKSKKPELIEYLKAKQLYVNEKIDESEDM